MQKADQNTQSMRLLSGQDKTLCTVSAEISVTNDEPTDTHRGVFWFQVVVVVVVFFWG